MGTKRPFDENLQEFIKYPKLLENTNTPDLFVERQQSPEPSQSVVPVGEGGETVIAEPYMVENPFETRASLPSVSGIPGHEDAPGPGLGPTLCPGLFSDFFEFNMPRRTLVHFDDTYTSLLNCSPRKEVPIGPDHQVDVPEYDSDSARNYTSQNEQENTLTGVCVISHQEDETVTTQTDCTCMDNGSVGCVQQHVNEARLNLKQSLGLEKFVNLGFNNMGEEVACNWVDEEQQFQDIIYSNPYSHGKKFWDVLSAEFPTRTKKDIVSYYFNVFIYRRRAVQNRSRLLAIDSDDDEWWGIKQGLFGVTAENEDSVNHVDHDHDSLSEGGETVFKENPFVNEGQSEQEKPVVANNVGLRSESYLHWDPPYSTMGSTKGVDLLPTCSMIEEIFGSSGKST